MFIEKLFSKYFLVGGILLTSFALMGQSSLLNNQLTEVNISDKDSKQNKKEEENINQSDAELTEFSGISEINIDNSVQYPRDI